MTSTADLIAAARSHSIGDIPRRTAARMPHKTAIVNGDVRLTFAELDAVIDAGACALAPTTVVDLTPMDRGGDPELVRAGRGPLDVLGL